MIAIGHTTDIEPLILAGENDALAQRYIGGEAQKMSEAMCFGIHAWAATVKAAFFSVRMS